MPETLTLSTTEQTLANGARLLYSYRPDAPRLAMALILPGGNRLETIPGQQDMLDRLLLKGTTHRTQEQIATAIDGLSLDLDVDTKRDYSLMYATLLEEDLSASLDLIQDVFFNASFTELEREKVRMLGEIQMDLDSPRSRASDQFIRAVFGDTPYNTVGSVLAEHLDRIDSKTVLKRHYQAIYQPNRLIISAAGPVKPETLAKQLEQFLPQPQPVIAEPADPAASAIRALHLDADGLVTFARDDSNQAHIFKGWLMPDALHPDYYPMVVLNTVLGAAGLSSRLFVELRDKQGLAYNVRSTYDVFCHRGLFSLYIGTDPKNKDKCLQGFITECDKLMQTPVPAQELAEAKQNLLGRRAVYLETAAQQASYVGTNTVLGRSLRDIDELADRIQAVTAAEIQRVAQTYLSQPSVVSIVAPASVL